MAAPDRLRREVERQRAHLANLPRDFRFPLFNAKAALEAMRSGAYLDTAEAARGIIDNAIDAGAGRIDVALRSDSRDAVSAVSFIDDGSGMTPEMARYALIWGGGTRGPGSPAIGRFDVGLPNSSINQTRLTYVYTRTDASEPFTRVMLNLDQIAEWGVREVEPGVPAEPPDWIRGYLDRNGLDLAHGTIVVWERPDRLSPASAMALRGHLARDFAVTYRDLFLGASPLQLFVEGERVEAVDPLFLTPGARGYLAPFTDVDAAEGGGARTIHDVVIPVRSTLNEETGEPRLERLTSLEQVGEEGPATLAVGAVQVRVARLPYGFAMEGGDADIPNWRLEVRKGHRGMAFVRSNREIVRLVAFPQAIGHWPVLQTYAYHWGIEVRFQPALDDVFGITHDKRGVRPIDDFWRVLVDVGVDEWARAENRWQSQIRGEQRQERANTT